MKNSKPESGNTLRQFWQENRGLFLFIVLMSVFRSSVADWNYIPSASMRPTIIEGDRVLINKVAYDVQLPFLNHSISRHADPERGDVIVFESEAADIRLIKRVIGIPGDKVTVLGNRVVRNGQPLQYQAIGQDQGEWVLTESDGHRLHTMRPGVSLNMAPDVSPQSRAVIMQVPDDHYLVLGDNRNNSADSRYYGFVPRDEIIGRSRRVVMSHNPEKFYIPRKHRWMEALHQELR